LDLNLSLENIDSLCDFIFFLYKIFLNFIPLCGGLTFEDVHQDAGWLRVAGNAGEISRMLASCPLNGKLR